MLRVNPKVESLRFFILTVRAYSRHLTKTDKWGASRLGEITQSFRTNTGLTSILHPSTKSKESKGKGTQTREFTGRNGEKGDLCNRHDKKNYVS